MGRNLINYIIRKNPDANIRILDNLCVGSRKGLGEVCTFKEKLCEEIKSSPTGVELVVADIKEYEACFLACKSVQIVIHLAACTGVAFSVEMPGLDMEANVIGTFNMLEAARQNSVKKFIFASSGASIGDVVPPIHEEKVCKPISPYGASKMAGEGYCSAFYRTYGLNTVSLRFGNVYGQLSNHKSSVIAKFIKQALKNEVLTIYGDGDQSRDFIYIGDLIQAIKLSVEVDVGGEMFQIATNSETTVNIIAELLKKIIKEDIGETINVVHGESRVGDMRRNYSDISKAEKLLGFVPQVTIKEGLKITLDWFITQSRNMISVDNAIKNSIS